MSEQQEEEVKSYGEIKSEQKLKKPLSDLAKKTRVENIQTARESKAAKAVEIKEQEKKKIQEIENKKQIQINEQTELLKKLQKKLDSDDSEEEEEVRPRKKKMMASNMQDMTYIIETLRNIEKKTDKLYTMKKSKYKQQQPLVINNQQPTSNGGEKALLSRQDYLSKLYKSNGMRI